jgi:hypothetical protein
VGALTARPPPGAPSECSVRCRCYRDSDDFSIREHADNADFSNAATVVRFALGEFRVLPGALHPPQGPATSKTAPNPLFTD